MQSVWHSIENFPLKQMFFPLLYNYFSVCVYYVQWCVSVCQYICLYVCVCVDWIQIELYWLLILITTQCVLKNNRVRFQDLRGYPHPWLLSACNIYVREFALELSSLTLAVSI